MQTDPIDAVHDEGCDRKKPYDGLSFFAGFPEVGQEEQEAQLPPQREPSFFPVSVL